MEYCPYCQRWVDPKKGHADWIGGTLVGGPIGLAVGGAYHLAKKPRCPICNSEIIKNQQTPSQPIYQPPPPPRTTHNCQTCGQILIWSPQLQRWQCNNCRITL